MKWRYGFLAVLGIVSFMLAPGGGLSAQKELAAEQVFRWGHGEMDIDTLDPAFAYTSGSYVIQEWIYNGLVRTKPGSLDFDNLEGDLAESWDISPDGLTYTFHLRKGVQWHNGYGEFTSDDVKAHFERILDPKLGMMFTAKYLGIKEIKALDRYTVQITLKKPNPFFLMDQLIAYQSGMIVPKKLLEERGKGNLGINVIGTGPFKVEKYISKEKITLVRNENYFRGAPTLEKIEFWFMPNTASCTFAFIKGDLDGMSGRRDPKWINDTLKKVPGAILDTIPIGSGCAVHFNMTKKPLDNIKVRQALAYAIDREQFHLFFGQVWREMTAPAPPAYLGALPKKETPEELLYNYDLEKAKKLLAEAGFEKGFALSAFSSSKPHYLATFELIKEMWKPLGVDLQLKVVDHTTFHHKIRGDQNDIVVQYAPRIPVAESYLTQFYHSESIVGKPKGVTNYSHYGEVDADGDGKVDSIDDLIDQAKTDLDAGMRTQAFYQAQLQLLSHAPSKPLHEHMKILLRQGYVDLGCEMEGNLIYSYPLEKARILKH